MAAWQRFLRKPVKTRHPLFSLFAQRSHVPDEVSPLSVRHVGALCTGWMQAGRGCYPFFNRAHPVCILHSTAAPFEKPRKLG